MISRSQGINNSAFVVTVSPDTVWYAWVLLLFSASAATDIGSKSFECALVSTLETYDDPENGNYINYITYMCLVCYAYQTDQNISGWLESVDSRRRVLYELDYKKPILYFIPIESILGKLPVVPVGDTGTIPHCPRNLFPGAPDDRRPGSADGCRMWFVNSWALGWSRDT